MPQSNSMLRVLRMFRWMTDLGQCNLGIAEPLLGGSDLGWLRPYLYHANARWVFESNRQHTGVRC